MTALLAAACGVAGLAVGSFLNVVIATVPHRESVASPRSRCPHCATRPANRDNVPVVSWLLLRGRCRTCGERISARYPLVEVATGVLFALAAVRFGASWALPAYLVGFAALVAVTAVDLEHYRIPDRIVFPTLGMATAALVVAAVAGDGTGSLGGALAGAALYFVMLFLPHLVYPKGMGFGDVKLALVLGLLLGWIDPYLVLLGLIAGCVLGVAAGLATVAVRRRREFPFGPALAASTVAVVLLSQQLLEGGLA
jgi:leader peptidase (prepilin peptidase) / N-methyltransferase